MFSWVSVLLLAAPANHSGSSRAIIYVCSIYRGGGGGGRGKGVLSTSGEYHEYIGGYHKYIGVCSEHQKVTMMQVRDMIHVGGYHEYIGECSVH